MVCPPFLVGTALTRAVLLLFLPACRAAAAHYSQVNAAQVELGNA